MVRDRTGRVGHQVFDNDAFIVQATSSVQYTQAERPGSLLCARVSRVGRSVIRLLKTEHGGISNTLTPVKSRRYGSCMRMPTCMELYLLYDLDPSTAWGGFT